MPFFKKSTDETISLKKILIFLVTVCVFVTFAFVQFYQQIQTTIWQESEHYLSEISTRMTSNITRVIDDNFSVLKTMSTVIEGEDEANFSASLRFLAAQADFWDFTNILLIDDSNIAYDLGGNAVSITGDSFLRGFDGKSSLIALNQIINNEEKTIFSSPLKNVVIEGKNIIALATIYNSDQFDLILSMSSFDKEAYSYIVTSQGKVVVQSSSISSNTLGYNVFQTFLVNGDTPRASVDKMKNDMNLNIAGQVEVNLSGYSEYLIYTPVGVEDWFLFTFVPTSLVNAKSNMLLRSTLVITFVIILIFLIFLTVIVRSFTRHKKRLEQIAYVDVLTKGNTVQKFHDLAVEVLNDVNKKYALIYTNIQRFKVLNDQFGRLICDQILISLHDGIKYNLRSGEHMAHYSADNFVVILEYNGEQDLQDKFTQWEISSKIFSSKYMTALPSFTMEYGIYVIEDPSVSVVDMIDRSKLALRSGTFAHKDDHYVRYVFYNDAVRHALIKEKHLEDMMETSLEDEEFQVYMQPKYITGTQTIAGAEALVRWQSKSDGMIFPNDFIPLFEKNGFIVRLDLWMFEQVCKILQAWKDAGKQLICVSVNCSRAHLKNLDFLNAYINIFKKYDFEAKYLELEFTENMVFEENHRLAKIIDDIHSVGFECSMDDFGSGYSSLNLLQDIHIDTLKLDRIFFKTAFSDSSRTKAIISCILDMAQSLEIRTVAEGIEDWEQVNVLQSLGCDLIQGYVYAKPMPITDFEKLFFDGQL